MPQIIRTLKPEELTAWFEAFSTSFYIWRHDPAALAEARRPTAELDRLVGAFEGDEIVGTFRSFATQLTLPGGARVPANAVSAVSVRPTHRRRGTLNRMHAFDMERATARGDAACVLISAEWPIYGRYGYGPATWNATWTLRTRAATFEVEPVGSIDIVETKAAREILPGLYDRCAAAQPGEISRPDHRWDVDLGLVEVPGRPRFQGLVAIHRDAAGEPDGYVRYHGEEVWPEGIPDNVLQVDELHGTSIEVEIDLWRFLAQMDLTASVKAPTRREHEPLPWYLADARAARSSDRTEFLWVRPLDVARLLGERGYDRDGALVLEVEDAGGPAAGRYRLEVEDGRATCERTDARADLTIDVRHLGAAILGGTRLTDAVRARGVTEHEAGALALADALLFRAEPPWCSTFF